MMARKLLTAGAIAIATMAGTALAQAPAGRVYSFHSGPTGKCPGLDWHVVAAGNGTLSGMIAWNNMQSMARVTGSVNMQAKTFSMSAKEVGGQERTAIISGTVRPDGWLVADISGPNVTCSGITVQWFVPSATGG